jgi:hypothetical protein
MPFSAIVLAIMDSQLSVAALRLGAGLDQALGLAQSGSLTFQAWTNLYDEESAFERKLIDASGEAYQLGDFGGAARLWETIADLNHHLVSIGGLLIKHRPADSPDPDGLSSAVHDAADMATFAEARSLLLKTLAQRLSGSPAEAAVSAEAARQKFDSLATSSSALSTLASVEALTAEGYRLATSAQAEQFRLQFEDASLTFIQAEETLKKARSRALETQDVDAALIAGMDFDIRGVEVASIQSNFLGAIYTGNFEKAAEHVQDMLNYYDSLDLSAAPPFLRQSAELDRRSYGAYLAYVQAEVAANKQEWDAALQLCNRAEDEWQEVVKTAMMLAIPQSRNIAETVQAVSSQVIGTCRRRIAREQSFYATINKLNTENQQLHHDIYNLARRANIVSQGGVTVKESGDQYSIGMIGQAASVGSDNTVSGTSMSQVNVDALAGIDMKTLADQLGELIGRLKAEAGEPDQYSALSEVSYAAQAAKNDDKAGTMQHLKAAGKWVLGVAQKIGVPVAVAALKGALGVP